MFSKPVHIVIEKMLIQRLNENIVPSHTQMLTIFWYELPVKYLFHD